jgi:hypothetical protein
MEETSILTINQLALLEIATQAQELRERNDKAGSKQNLLR